MSPWSLSIEQRKKSSQDILDQTVCEAITYQVTKPIMLCVPIHYFHHLSWNLQCYCHENEHEGGVDDERLQALIFDEGTDLNCDTVPLPTQRSVSTLINLVKVIGSLTSPVLVYFKTFTIATTEVYIDFTQPPQTKCSFLTFYAKTQEFRFFNDIDVDIDIILWRRTDLIYWLMITLSPLR